MIDNIGIGGRFPLPIGTYNNHIIGEINPFEIDLEQIKDVELKKIRNDISVDDNPILVFYKIVY